MKELSRKEGVTCGFDRFVAGVFVLTTVLVAAVVLLVFDAATLDMLGYHGYGLIPSPVWGIIDAVVILISAALIVKLHAKRRSAAGKGMRMPLLLLAAALLFMVQLFVTYHTYSMPAHDEKDVFEAAYYAALGYPEYVNTGYFDVYPNNLLLMVLEMAVISLPRLLLGLEMGQARAMLLLVVCMCVLNSCSGVITALLTQKIARMCGFSKRTSGIAAWASWGLWCILVGLSPWFLVVYSDSATVLAPALLALLYLCRGSGKRAVLTHAALGLLGAATFKLKPQSSLILIAILMADAVALVIKKGERKAMAAQIAALVVAGAFVFGPVQGALQRITGIDPDPQKQMSFTHYINMGLNQETFGIYSPDDALRALQIESAKERNQMSLESAAERVRAFGPLGLLEHWKRKAVINFADGAFSWDDMPREDTLPIKSNLSLTMREIVYEEGAYFPYVHSVMQGAWILVLLLCPFAAFALREACRKGKRAGADGLGVMMLTVVGVMTFNMLFEARGRYIFSTVPVMIVLAVVGACSVLRAIDAKRASGS